MSQNGITVKESVSASKKLGKKDALAIASQASSILIARGKKISRLNMKDGPSEKEILSHMLGPTGNLRAPTAVVGKKVLVGFAPEIYEEVLG